MIYTDSVASFTLSSSWRCTYKNDSSGAGWVIVGTPSQASHTATFSVDLPQDAVINRVWLTMGLSSPLSGSAYRRVNGISIPSDGTTELPTDDFSALTTSFDALFTFRANGLVFQDENVHSGSLTISNLTLNIEYNATSSGEGDGSGGNDSVSAATSNSKSVKLPRLLTDNFQERARLHPDSMRLMLKLDPKSGASMTLSLDEPKTQIGDFLELFSPHGSAGIFRVIEEETVYGVQERKRIYLEHAIGTLADSLAIGTQSLQAPVAAVFATLLEAQNVKHWEMGDCDVPADYELIYEYSYENLLQSITNLTAQLPPEYMWEFDMTHHPFVMHLHKLPDGDPCEMRLSRNLSSVTVTMDRSNLCTRVIPFGAGEGQDRMTLSNLVGSLHLDSESSETWGIVSRTITAENVFDAPTLKTVAERYLQRYDHPTVNVVADASDLSAMTGERLDYFRNGALCRVALNDYGIRMEERVIQTTWPDVFSQPMRVDVTIAERIRDASDEMAELMREATNSKLLGGTVETIEDFSRASGIMPGTPFAHSFEITGYGNVLNVRTKYKCTTSAGADARCHLTVDGNAVDDSEAAARTVDITKYLTTDANGVPLVGTHRIIVQPATLNTVTSVVENTITIKQIAKR